MQVYSFEDVVYHVLHRRTPLFSFRTLSEWWKNHLNRWRVCQYYVTRCHGNLDLLDEIDFINRTSELARVFGILFYSVISRGSQVCNDKLFYKTNPNYIWMLVWQCREFCSNLKGLILNEIFVCNYFSIVWNP